MRLGVIVEHHFYKVEDEYWALVQCDADFWNRYLDVFDEIVVCARIKVVTRNCLPRGAMLSSRAKVSFCDLPDFEGSVGLFKNYFKVREGINSLLSQIDRLIFRSPNTLVFAATPQIIKSNIPFAMELATNPKTAYSREAMKSALQPIFRSLMVHNVKRLARQALGVSYVTEHVLQDEYPCSFMLNGTGFTSHYSTITLYRNDYYFDNGRKELVGDELRLLHVGTMFGNRKGQDIFLETISLLKERGYLVKGILCGDGPSRSEFVSLAHRLGVADQVSFVGWKTQEEIKNLIDKSDIFLFPTRGEGLPRVILEAMSRGLICVGSGYDGMVELLSNCSISENNEANEYLDIIEGYMNDARLYSDERLKQFSRSKEYESCILEKRRSLFYRRLHDSNQAVIDEKSNDDSY